MEKENRVNKINEIYNGLTILQKRELRNEICAASGYEYYSFLKRLRNDSWSQLEREGIHRILKRRGYES